MTTRRIKISRHGLTRCPACKAHIQVALSLADTICPFCQATISDANIQGSAGAFGRLMGSGRSALIAASLLGVPAMGACGDDTGSTPDDDVSTDTSSADAEGDVGFVQPYGLPPDMFEEPEADVQTDAELDFGPAPPYGQPPDEGPPE